MMFAKGTYLTDRAFYMTYRFDMAEKVSPEAIKKAWDKTTAIYPYVTYAEATRNGKLILLENTLPFVIEETGEVIEPYERSGNFHSVTFCYLDKVLWMYVDHVDHVPYDGTGFKAVLETFFYYYYCELDGKEYPVPEGVFTEKDGVVPGQDTDAYLMSDATDLTYYSRFEALMLLAHRCLLNRSALTNAFIRGLLGDFFDFPGFQLHGKSVPVKAYAHHVPLLRSQRPFINDHRQNIAA